MNSIKCPECNLTNWATVAGCQRCGFLFQTFEPDDQSPANAFAEQSNADANHVFDNQTYRTPSFESRDDWSPDQNYQGQNYRNYQTPNHRYDQSANLKIGLAIASMILGIAGFTLSIFLVGILLAPVGLVLGIVALVKANKKPKIYGGKGFAIAGIATSALVVLFVPIVAAIAIPNLLAARRAANEGSAISSLRTLAAAQRNFMQSNYSKRCGDLPSLAAGRYIDNVLAKGEKSGYRFMVVNLPSSGCELHAVPQTASTGTRSFYFSTEDNIMRTADKKGKFADQNDSPLDDDARRIQISRQE